MPQFAANLSMLYPEIAFLDRFEAAAKDGFKGVEFLFPYAWEKADIAARLKANGLQQVLFNMPPAGLSRDDIAREVLGSARGTACVGAPTLGRSQKRNCAVNRKQSCKGNNTRSAPKEPDCTVGQQTQGDPEHQLHGYRFFRRFQPAHRQLLKAAGP